MLYPELTKVWFRIVVGTLLLLKPETCSVEPEAVQVNKVPETLEVRVIPVVRLLHCDLLAGLFERFGVG